jgi:hypothetical protein
LLPACLELLGAELEQVQIGTELEPNEDDKMDDHRQQNAIPARDGAADDELILVTILEVEMYQRSEGKLYQPRRVSSYPGMPGFIG